VGAALREVTWVTLEEVSSGDWGIAGKPLTTEFVPSLRTGEAVAG
jgi:4-oxalocrotonate tautomerase